MACTFCRPEARLATVRFRACRTGFMFFFGCKAKFGVATIRTTGCKWRLLSGVMSPPAGVRLPGKATVADSVAFRAGATDLQDLKFDAPSKNGAEEGVKML